MSKELQTDTTLSHYRIISNLGAGGMGERSGFNTRSWVSN
jgi:hypothetical protein